MQPAHVFTDKTVLFFDDLCNLCNGLVTALIALDRRRKLLYASLRGLTAIQQFGQQETQSLHSLLVVHQGFIYRESDAVLRIMKSLGSFWVTLAFILRLVPRFIRDMVYRFVARNRYRWFGQKDVCRIPTPEERDSFLP